MSEVPRRPTAGRSGAPSAVSRFALRAMVVLFALGGVIMLAILIEARSARLPEEVLLPVNEEDIRWMTPVVGDAGTAPDVVHRRP